MSVSQTIENHPQLEGVTKEHILDLVWDHGIVGFTLVGLDNRFVHPSATLCEWLGYTREQLEKMSWVDVTIRSDKQDDLDAVKSLLAGETDKYKMFKTYIRRNETLMPATLVVLPVKDSTEKVVFFLSQISEDERYHEVPSLSQIQVVWDFLRLHKRNLTVLLLASHVAAALTGKYFLLWLAEFMALFGWG